jgi:hypothetical protein
MAQRAWRGGARDSTTAEIGQLHSEASALRWAMMVNAVGWRSDRKALVRYQTTMGERESEGRREAGWADED